MTLNEVLEVETTKMTFIVSESKMATVGHIEFIEYQKYVILYITLTCFISFLAIIKPTNLFMMLFLISDDDLL